MIVIAPALWFVCYSLRLPAACQTLTRMTTCREPKVCLAGANFSRKVNHTLSKRQSFVISKRKFFCGIRL